MTMILILLFMLGFCLDILNLKNAKSLKKHYKSINDNSVLSQQMVELLCARGWCKINRDDFYCVILLMYTIWEYLMLVII